VTIWLSQIFYVGFIVCLYWYNILNAQIDQDDRLNPKYEFIEWQTYILDFTAESTMQVTLWSNKICLILVYQHFT
jgi:hypothetical protein